MVIIELIFAGLLVWWGRSKALRDARLAWLPMAAPVVAQIGVVGTIYGLITAFHSIGNVPPAEKQKLLSDGISRAMTSTAIATVVSVTILIACAVWFAMAPSKAQGSRDTTVS